MKKHFVLIALVTAFVTLGIISYSAYAPQIWAKFNTHNAQSNLIDRDTPSWKAEASQIGNDKDIENFYFCNENIAYGISYRKFGFDFYRTSDGGKSWEKRASMNDAAFNNIFFTTPTEGFVVLSKSKSPSTPNANEGFIIKTADGGISWKTVYSSNNVSLYKLSFDSSGESGILIGDRTASETASPNHFNLVLMTNDRGQTWTDVSQNLKNKIPVENEQLTNVFFLEGKEIVVLSSGGKIFKTIDYGKSWSLVAMLADKEPQIGFNRFGELENKNFWVAGATRSIEGKWSEIAVTKKFGWNRYKLNNYYFSDVVFLSNDTVIACGSAFKFDTSSNTAKELTAEVVVYSANAGKDWETVYMNPAGWKTIDAKKNIGFYSIFKISKDKVLISGENGIELMLNRIPKSAEN